MSAMTPQVSVIVLNWNRWQHTLACLESLDSLDYPDFDVVVVDNGSEDGSQARIEAARPDLTLLQTGANLGYAGGNNVGIGYALERGADYVWVLNNDTLVESGSLAELVAIAEANPPVGIVGSAVVNSLPQERKTEVAATAYLWKGERMIGLADDTLKHRGQEDGLPVEGLAGTSMLLRASVLAELGGFDERYFHYFEDVELCERFRRAGWQIRYAQAARVWHEISASMNYQSPQARYYYIRNWLLFSRWSRKLGMLPLLIRDPALCLGRITGVRWLARLRWRVAAAGMLGALDAMRGRHGRRDLQHRSFARIKSD
jgi:GT2 family glycosyltransferase